MILRAVIFSALVAAWLAPRPVAAQTDSAVPAPLRIVVFRFASTPDDSTHRVLSETIAASLFRALSGDSSFLVMPHPRGRTGEPNARYGIIGAVAVSGRTLRIDVRVVDIESVSLVAMEKAEVVYPSSNGVLSETGKILAHRIHQRLAGSTR